LDYKNGLYSLPDCSKPSRFSITDVAMQLLAIGKNGVSGSES
jgi:hypothetical protein